MGLISFRAPKTMGATAHYGWIFARRACKKMTFDLHVVSVRLITSSNFSQNFLRLLLITQDLFSYI